MKFKNIYLILILLNIVLTIYSEETETIISNSTTDNPFHDRVHVVWEGENYEMTFEGVQQISETKLGSYNRWVDGIAFHPNGAIAFSDGRGSTPIMIMEYWSLEGVGESVVNLQYVKNSEKPDENKTEEKGYFSFFAGSLAFDPNGVCYFSLGSVSPNGLYKVVSNSPVEIEKLYSLDATRSLQIPLFDKKHLYSTSGKNGIFRYPILPNQKKPKKLWFSVQGEKILLSNCLIINQNQVITEIVFKTPKGTSKKDYYIKSFIFNRLNKSYRILSLDEIGPMAISWDGKKMIRFDMAEQSINEFSLDSQ